jgi:hypothetical protein
MGSTLATINRYVCHVIGAAQAPSGCETVPEGQIARTGGHGHF